MVCSSAVRHRLMPHSAQDAGRVSGVITGPRARVDSIDLLRGLIVIII